MIFCACKCVVLFRNNHFKGANLDRVIRHRISFNECAYVVQLDDVRQGMASTLLLAGNKNICGINFGE